MRTKNRQRFPIAMNGAAVLLVLGLTYLAGFGIMLAAEAIVESPANMAWAGESGDKAQAKLKAAGSALFKKQCADCHFADKTDAKMGPGLKGLFKMSKLPVSGRPMTEANIIKQLKTPYDEMPAFLDLKEKDIQALMGYLKSL